MEKGWSVHAERQMHRRCWTAGLSSNHAGWQGLSVEHLPMVKSTPSGKDSD